MNQRSQPTAATTLAELAVSYPSAVRVFHRNRLDFCCGGRRTLADACRERQLDPDGILAAIEAEAPTGGATRWDEAPIADLVRFIVETHHRRLRDDLPGLIAMARRVELRHADKPGCPRGLAGHLAAMHESVLDHLRKEEEMLFPLIVDGQGDRAAAPVHVMELEHERHREDLLAVRRLTADLAPPPDACTTWRALYLGLQQLELDLMEHIHLENNVLFRRALAA